MTVEIRVPRLAESVSDAVLVEWLKPDGGRVGTDEPVAVLETDKAAVEIAAEQPGVLHHARSAGDRVVAGDVIARVEVTDGAAPAKAAPPAMPPAPAKGAPPAMPPAPAKAAPPAPAAAPAAAKPAPPAPASAQPPALAKPAAEKPPAAPADEDRLSPAVRRLVEEHGLDPATIAATGPGGRLLKEDVLRHLESSPPAPAATPAAPGGTPAPAPAGPAEAEAGPDERVVPMSRIRQRIAERLVRAQHTAAILTTFNEIDMTAVATLRARHREAFEKRHGVRLGLMSFFARACVLALGDVPELNAEIRGTDVVYRRTVHLGVAVSTGRGLVVPVVRDAHRLGFAGLEREIARLGESARAGTLTPQELSGGTFTLTNGGVFGSLLSTPILNPPQSGILGMHKIEKRPVAIEDQVVIRPMMYVALSYDHRLVDGEQAVSFLVSVKQRVEDPERVLLEL